MVTDQSVQLNIVITITVIITAIIIIAYIHGLPCDEAMLRYIMYEPASPHCEHKMASK